MVVDRLCFQYIRLARVSPNHLEQILYLSVQSPFLRVFGNFLSSNQLKLKLLYFVQIITCTKLYYFAAYIINCINCIILELLPV